MKKTILSLALVAIACFSFADENTYNKHNFFVGVQNFFSYYGLSGFLTYGYNLDENNLLKVGIDVGYGEEKDINFDQELREVVSARYGCSIAWWRYLLRNKFRPFAGLGASYGYIHDSETIDDVLQSETIRHFISVSIPLGIEYSFSGSFGIGLESGIALNRTFHEGESIANDDILFDYDYVSDSISPSDYKFYMVFRF